MESNLEQTFMFLGLGMFIVLTTLAGLSILCAITGFFFKRIEAAKQSQKGSMAPQRNAPREAAVDSAQLPVIAAAVTVALGVRHYHITRIAPAYGLEEHNSWAMEGRRQIFASHIYARH